MPDRTKNDQELLERLEGLSGWTVRLSENAEPLPSTILKRYEWLPSDVRRFVGRIREAVGPEGKVWFLTISDYAGTSNSAYSWDEWERLSLAAAGDDSAWRGEITRFWSDHFPLALSVKSGYAYFALDRTSLGVVVGEEPEFDQTETVATSLQEFLQLLRGRNSKTDRWA